MMRAFMPFAALAMTLAAPVSAQTAAPMTPAQAIAAAAAAPSGKVDGVVEFTAVSTGASGFNVFLNSAADYHDPANLSAELHPVASNALRQKFGGYPDDVLKGKRVRIKGTLRRVATDKAGTIFQTRIDVDNISQIEVLG